MIPQKYWENKIYYSISNLKKKYFHYFDTTVFWQ